MTLREQARHRRPKIGHFVVEFATPGIGHILKNAGCDFAVLDLEHGPFGIETVAAMVRYCEAAALPCVVRTSTGAGIDIARALDAGADGILVPMVSSADQAREIVQAARYHPAGRRGVALGIAHDRYRSGPVASALHAANDRVAVFLLIETAAGVAAADEIAAVEGVDCLWIGHYDLSCSLGTPGDFADPRFVAALETIRAACTRHGRSLGRLANDVADGVALARAGCDFLSFAGDVWVYGAAVAAGVSGLRAQLAT